MVWRATDPQANESAKVKYDAVPYTRGRGLDIGCGAYKAFPHFIGVDNMHHAQEFGWDYEPNLAVDSADNLDIIAGESMDFVFSSHLLEHMEDIRATLQEWWRVIKVGGYLVLYLPDDELYPKVGEPGANPDHKHNLNRKMIRETMRKIGSWDLVVEEQRNTDNGEGEHGNEYSFYQVFKKRHWDDGAGNRHNYPCYDEKPGETACVVRYGGFGDMIQASTVFPYLKEQGYHITVMTTPRGQNLLSANPYVDDFIIQDTDQVPNNELCYFWNVWREKFDKFINLSESVEGSLLALPGRTMYDWPAVARNFMLDRNYLEMTHMIADIPMGNYQPHFFPNGEEEVWAAEIEKTINPGKRPVIAWSLAGSSVHKAWPWLDIVVARIMTETDAIVVTMGDELCQVLEMGWENEPRVIRTSGIWDIRQSITYAQKQADMVIGTETGLLNAVGMEPVNKIITLSHSSEENLTKHWKNVQALTPDPEHVTCFPCHQMHYGFPYCRKHDETGCAICQVDISADQMWSAILKWYNSRIILEAG